MPDHIALALLVRRRFSRPSTAMERACYDVPPARLPVVVVGVNEKVVALEYDPKDRAALEALGVECA